MVNDSAEDLRDAVTALMPLTGTLGIRAVEVGAAQTVLTLDWRADLCTAGGALHGGTIMALADCAGGACAYAGLVTSAPGARTSTIESGTHFFAAVTGGTLTATARPLHSGRSTVVVQTEVRRDDGKLVAVTTQTQAVLR
jgi:1,4-dihydroxy-2-naphthoyl-CoA hydrolase